MKPITKIVIVAFFAGAAWCPAAKAQDNHVGWIEKIESACDGKWRADENSQPRPLQAAADRFRFLYPGDSVRCDGHGSMSLQILDNQAKSISKRDGWCKIHNEEAICEKEKSGKSSDSAAVKHNPDQEALTAFGRPGGRQRGLHSAIFAPAAGSTVRADKLVVRWNEMPGATRITLRLTDKYHLPLWEQADVEARAGSLVSPEARLALAAYRGKGGANPFSLMLTNDGTPQPVVNFSILSVDEERALDKDLTRCDKKPGLLLFACRTYALTQRALWNDAAEEYEAALKLEPASRELLLAALAAERDIGNTARVSELTEKLPAGTKVPE
jgi:hypothetical protein